MIERWCTGACERRRGNVLGHMNNSAGQSGEGAGETIESLLARIGSGDRGAAATFMERYAPLIRRRIRGRLSAGMRRLFDSQEIMATLVRRLDAMVADGRLDVRGERQLVSLVLTMAEHAVIDKARMFARLRAVESDDAAVANAILRRLNHSDPSEAADVAVADLFDVLEDPTDRQILSLWLTGTQHNITAEIVGLSAPAVRKRWQSIRAKLREHLVLRDGGQDA